MRLLLDAMCGHLTGVCRMCGHDTVYALDEGLEDDGRLLALVRETGRTLVTRDVQLASRADRSVLLSGVDHDEHLRALRDAGVDLTLQDRPTYCGRCNGPVERVDEPEQDGGAHPAYVPDGERPVWRCTECGQHFWKGSHWAAVRERLAKL